MTSSALLRAGQSLSPGDLVALYIIDLSPIGVAQQFAFTSNVDRSRGVVKFRGVSFTPIEVKCEGFSVTGQGALPQPTISIGNVTRTISSAALLYNDLVGAKLTRFETYAQFLDDGATPDPDGDGTYPPDVYRFEQKTVHTKRLITWSLAAAMDQEGRMLPGRTIIRDVCPFRYRRWDPAAGAFNYTGVKCPYTGAQAYDRDGNKTTSDKDDPGRNVANCCKVRFGATASLPFGGFPGVARVRV